MKKTLVIFGNITFQENPLVATIHNVESTFLVPDIAGVATGVGELMVNLWDAYIVPSQYKGEIIWE